MHKILCLRFLLNSLEQEKPVLSDKNTSHVGFSGNTVYKT